MTIFLKKPALMAAAMLGAIAFFPGSSGAVLLSEISAQDKAGWKLAVNPGLRVSSEASTNRGIPTGKLAFDLNGKKTLPNLATHWQSEAGHSGEHFIEINLGKKYLLNGFKHVRARNTTKGHTAEYTFYVGNLKTATAPQGTIEYIDWELVEILENGQHSSRAQGEGLLAKDKTSEAVEFVPINGEYVKFVSKGRYARNKQGNEIISDAGGVKVADIGLYGTLNGVANAIPTVTLEGQLGTSTQTTNEDNGALYLRTTLSGGATTADLVLNADVKDDDIVTIQFLKLEAGKYVPVGKPVTGGTDKYTFSQTGLAEGTHQYRLTVKDPIHRTLSFDISVTVDPAPVATPQPPGPPRGWGWGPCPGEICTQNNF